MGVLIISSSLLFSQLEFVPVQLSFTQIILCELISAVLVSLLAALIAVMLHILLHMCGSITV